MYTNVANQHLNQHLFACTVIVINSVNDKTYSIWKSYAWLFLMAKQVVL